MTDAVQATFVRRLTIRYYVFLFVKQLNLWAPLYILFVMARGFSLTEATLLSSVWWATAVALEVPTGMLADRWGRKTSLVLSSVFLVAAFVALYYAHTFWIIGLAYILWAASVSLASGADSALLYDSLLEAKAEESYRPIYGRAVSIAIVASGIGALAGGLLGEINLAWPILASACLAVVEIFILMTFREPRVDSSKGTPPLAQLKSLGSGVLTRPLWGILAVNAMIYTGVWVLGVFYQPHLISLGYRVAGLGVLYLIFKFIGAAGSLSSAKMGQRLGEHRQLFLMPLVLGVVVLAIGAVGASWVVVFIAMTYFINASLRPLISTLINQRVESRHRATVLSLSNLLGSLVLVPVQPLMGAFAETMGMAAGFYLIAGFILVGGVIAIGVSRMLSQEQTVAG